jgi:signal transduction histidine kinase
VNRSDYFFVARNGALKPLKHPAAYMATLLALDRPFLRRLRELRQLKKRLGNLQSALRGFTEQERELMNRLLHDLKNELLAAQVLCASNETSRTTRFRNQYQASQHLDAASALCTSIQVLQGALESPIYASFSIRDFFRDFVTGTLSVVPSRVRLVPPTNLGEKTINTSAEFLRSILRNLIKNSVEAIDGAGEILLEWSEANDGGKIVISVSDTGKGMTPERVECILSGAGTKSNKVSGSGVGLSAVKAMVRRLAHLRQFEKLTH